MNLKWKDLMKLSVEEIRESYPRGAVMDANRRWSPGTVHVEAWHV